MAIENIKIANGTAVPVKDAEAHSLITSLTSTVNGLTSTVNGKPTFANLPNRNLLDNWYFAKPVNQRGATTYTTNGFTIDRWYLAIWSTISPSVKVLDGCVAIACTPAAGDTNSTYLRQALEHPGQLSGKTVTLSAKLKNVTVDGDPRLIIYYETGDGSASRKYTTITTAKANSVVSVSATLPTDLTVLHVEIGNDANGGGDGNFNIEIESVKLELGSVSTLANDAPPNYAEELLKCQRYYIRWFNTAKQQAFTGGAAGTAVYAAVQLPTILYGTATPTVTYEALDIYNFVSNGSIAVKSCGCNILGSRNSVILWVTYDSTSTCPGQTPASIRIGDNGYIALSCEI